MCDDRVYLKFDGNEDKVDWKEEERETKQVVLQHGRQTSREVAQ